MTVRLLALLVVLAGALPAFAVSPDELLKDPAQEKRARTISAELRCLVCQNQSIDDSDASLAKELRLIVREQISAGKSDDEIRSFLVERYGEWVLLRPKLHLDTALLWGLPFIAVAGGGLFLLGVARRKRRATLSVAPLTEAEAQALEQRLAAAKDG